ncbi:MAG: elongation factor P [Candidatus Lindowbacteria bacterium]|nr:elongation factor P [Candidatus Lindowbacteria bacterium]
MLKMNELKRGMCIKLDGKLVRIVEFQHVKPGKGAAFTRTKIKHVSTGRVVEKTFRASDNIEQVNLQTKDMQLLYSDPDGYHFMDQESFEQITLDAATLGDAVNYLKDEDTIKVETQEGKPIGVELPSAVVLQVTEAPPAVKGNTATGATKTAVLETGFNVQVPLFIEQGEKVKIDTRSGAFLSRG